MAENTLVAVAHRLLAPRIAYLIGTKNPEGNPHCIPVSNLTSVSVQPQHVLLAVDKQWQTYRNLVYASGFTVSVPLFAHLDDVWKLGAKYSRFPVPPEGTLIASGLSFDNHASLYGPVLEDGLGWLNCQIIARHDLGGDHGIIIGLVDHVWFNPDYLNADGTPHQITHPLMQQTGNQFRTVGEAQSIAYYGEG
jgi:flavin reductase (DIM6/NTAB) family NADH-FMN oxidoreductase RutF